MYTVLYVYICLHIYMDILCISCISMYHLDGITPSVVLGRADSEEPHGQGPVQPLVTTPWRRELIQPVDVPSGKTRD